MKQCKRAGNFIHEHSGQTVVILHEYMNLVSPCEKFYSQEKA